MNLRILLIPLLACISIAAPLPVFQVKGRFLTDGCGDTVLIRGVEMPVNHMQYIPEYAKTKGNFVRILISGPNARWTTSSEDLASMLALVRNAGMGADISINDTIYKNGAQFTLPGYKEVLLANEDIITLHAQGEGTQATTAQWIADAQTAIDTIRGAGFRCPLYILSTTSGRDPFPVLNYGQQIEDYDPLHNILMGVQLYYGYTDNGAPGWYIRDYGATDGEFIAQFAQKDFPIIAGINNHDPYGDPWLDYETQLEQTAIHKIGWYWWDWNNPFDGVGKYHVTLTGNYGNWGEVLLGGPDMDYFTLTAPNGSSTRVEAESFSSRLGDSWGRFNHQSVSGGAFVCCGGKRPNDFLEYQVTVGATGDYDLEAVYANGGTKNKTVRVIVNGDSVETYQFPFAPGANDANFWRAWAPETITIPLTAGVNTLRFEPFGHGGVFEPDYGMRMVFTSPGSLENTSKKSSYMLNQTCADGHTPTSIKTPRINNAIQKYPSLSIFDLQGRMKLSPANSLLRP